MSKAVKTILVFVVIFIVGLIAASPANATEQPYFKKYDTAQTWYAPSPASVAEPFAVPQTLTVLECGGIRQDDKYTIDSAELEKQYQALLAGGVLRSPADDAPFHPRGVVTALPECVPPVVKPEKPAPVVEPSSSRGTPDCVSNTVAITNTVTTTDWIYDEATNTYVEGEPASVDTVVLETATAEECPPPVVVPPVDTPETPVDTPETTPVAPVVEVVAEAPKAPVTLTKAASVDVVPTEATALAYTGSEEWVRPVIGGAILAFLGLGLVIFARIRRGKAETQL